MEEEASSSACTVQCDRHKTGSLFSTVRLPTRFSKALGQVVGSERGASHVLDATAQMHLCYLSLSRMLHR